MEAARGCCAKQLLLLLLLLQLLLLLEEESALPLDALVFGDLVILRVAALAKLLKPYRQILGGGHNLLELVRHQPQLFSQLQDGGALPKFNGLDKCVLELACQVVGRLYLYIVVANRDKVCDSVMLHDAVSLKEGPDFPLLVIMGVEFFKLSARTNDRHFTRGKLCVGEGHESLG